MKRFALSRVFVFPLIVAACLLVLAACGTTGGTNNAQHEGHVHTEMANGDLREETASAKILPEFLNGKQRELQKMYLLAAEASDVLQWIPCYCGCGASAGHKSNLECFVHEQREDGTIVWDDHGTRCGTCIDIAFQSAKLTKEGKSIKEIREWVDQRYSNTGAEPTPTPSPM